MNLRCINEAWNESIIFNYNCVCVQVAIKIQDYKFYKVELFTSINHSLHLISFNSVFNYYKYIFIVYVG